MAAIGNPHVALWAKTARGKDNRDLYHPLICHLIDVAMVTHTMWREVLTPALRKRIATGLDIESEDAAGLWVAFLAGLHDLGKASPVFQKKNDNALARLRAAGLDWTTTADDPGHGTISALAMEQILPAHFALSIPVAQEIATAIGGHHGHFSADGNLTRIDNVLTCGNERWANARIDLAVLLAELLDIPRDTPPQRINHATSMVLAGLVSVADWIGSDERFFTYKSTEARAGTLDFDAYREYSASQAHVALDALGWLGWTPSNTSLSFSSLFPAIETPHQFQVEAEQIPGLKDSSGIVIAELPMGLGKTELAFFLADLWGVALGQRGVYVAMPTMATSNQMFGRLREFLARRYPDSTLNLQLLHSHAAISTELESQSSDDAPVVEPTETYGEDSHHTSADVLAGEWFTRRRRGLLAPFGVGTVDQSLLAALGSRHVFVRLFGLAGKTIIFDEVHAYDTYMSTLFERLLEWLGAVGSSVVILSATLPRNRRDKLIAAYAKGAGTPLSDTAAIPSAAYPRLSWLTAAGPNARHVEMPATLHRPLRVDWIDDDVEALGTRLETALREGGCAAVICNTVRRAQDTYRALQQHFKPDEIDLLHSRFPFEERDRREKQALIRFGKSGGTVSVEGGGDVAVQRPKRAVLVATQVIEQSLDLDFDLMVTDLAPADLVLQRSGRMHRHANRQRPEGLETPTLWIVRPARVDGDVPTFDVGSAYVYNDYVLLRSWLALKDRATIAIPDDVEPLIEAVYDERACAESASEPLRSRWDAALEALRKQETTEQAEAQTRYIQRPSSKGSLAKVAGTPRDDDAQDIHPAHQALTRLIRPTASVICLYQTPRGVALDLAGEHVVNPERKTAPSIPEAKRLLGRSVGIADPRVVYILLKQETPVGWQRSPLLRHSVSLVFDMEGIAEVNKHRVRLDPELGILVEASQSQGEER